MSPGGPDDDVVGLSLPSLHLSYLAALVTSGAQPVATSENAKTH